MSDRTVVVDLTEQEARTVAAFLDMGSEITTVFATEQSREDVLELRDRFLVGIAISQAEAVLRGRR